MLWIMSSNSLQQGQYMDCLTIFTAKDTDMISTR